jgi:hypothetical protein
MERMMIDSVICEMAMHNRYWLGFFSGLLAGGIPTGILVWWVNQPDPPKNINPHAANGDGDMFI